MKQKISTLIQIQKTYSQISFGSVQAAVDANSVVGQVIAVAGSVIAVEIAGVVVVSGGVGV